MTIRFERGRRKWMRDPKFRAEYERIGPEMDLTMTLAEAPRKAGLTQAELAARMKTSQAAVARIESGHGAPKWETIERSAGRHGMAPRGATCMPLRHFAIPARKSFRDVAEAH